MSEARQPSENELQAYADGRVDPEQRATIERWLAEHADESARIESDRRFGEGLRSLYDPVLDEPVPSRLMRAPGARRRWRPVAWAALWLLLGIAIGGLAGWQLHEMRPQAPVAMDTPA